LLLVLWLSCLAWPAPAMPIGYHLSYTFDSGEVRSGMLVGALQADNDTLLVDSVSMVSFTLAPASGFSQIMIRPPLASLSGNLMDLMSERPRVAVAGWQLNNNNGNNPNDLVIAVGNFGTELATFDTARWSISAKATAMPEPGAHALLAFGLLALTLPMRRPAK
jgi:hypothetical protein